MSEEIAQAIGDIADRARLHRVCVDQENEIARLTSTTIDLRAALAQQDDEIAAERRARQIAEADNAALLLIARRCATTMTWPQLIADSVALSAPHPGAALLAELGTTRAALAGMVDQYMRFSEGYISHEFMGAQEDAIEILERIGWLRGEQYERYYWTDTSEERWKAE